MKYVSQILCGAVAIATIASYAISYFDGRRGMPMSIAGLPAQIVPMLMSVFCLGSLVVLLVTGLVKGRPVGKTLSALALSLLFVVLGFAVVPAKVFQIGFRQRMRSTVSASELREIARFCHETLPIQTRLPGPGKWSLWNESEHRSHWNALVQATAVGKLDPSLTIFNGTDTVEIVWGGALVGHWGLIIQTDGKTETGDVAEGIRTFISSE
jgi:hypothetical protein